MRGYCYTDNYLLDLTPRQLEIITGSLLGDGYITSRDNKNPRFGLGQTRAKKANIEYLNETYKELSDLVNSPPKISNDNRGYAGMLSF